MVESNTKKKKRLHDVELLAERILLPSLMPKKQQRNQAKVDKIFEWARKELYKAEELLFTRKSTIVLETAKKLEDAGIEKNKITVEIVSHLKGFVDDSYVRKVLTDYPQYKDQRRSDNANKRDSSRKKPAKQAQTEQSQKEEHEEDDAPTGSYQIPVEEFNIKDVELYDRAFLIKLVHFLYQWYSKKTEDGEARKTE